MTKEEGVWAGGRAINNVSARSEEQGAFEGRPDEWGGGREWRRNASVFERMARLDLL